MCFPAVAGSESQKTAGTAGDRLKEAANINKSLSALVGYISYLSTQKNYVAYRNSKLTHLLSDSIGGNSKTTLIATINPSSDVFSDSLNTLNFAATAKEIKSDVKQNVSINGQRIDAMALQKKLNIVQKENDELKAKFNSYDDTLDSTRAQLAELDLHALSMLDASLAHSALQQQLAEELAVSEEEKRTILAEAEETVQVLETENDILRRELSHTATELQTLASSSTQSAQDSAHQTAQLRVELAELHQRLAATQAQLERTQTSKREVEEELDGMHSRMAEAERAAEQREKEFAAETDKMRQEYTDSMNLSHSLASELRESRAAHSQLIQRVSRGENHRAVVAAEERARLRQLASEVQKADEAAIAAIAATAAAPLADPVSAPLSPSISSLNSSFDGALASIVSESSLLDLLNSLTLKPAPKQSHNTPTRPVLAMRTPQQQQQPTPAQAQAQAGLNSAKKPTSSLKRQSASGWDKLTDPIERSYKPPFDLTGDKSIVVDENDYGHGDSVAPKRLSYGTVTVPFLSPHAAHTRTPSKLLR